MIEDPIYRPRGQGGGCLLHDGEPLLQAPERKVQIKYCKGVPGTGVKHESPGPSD